MRSAFYIGLGIAGVGAVGVAATMSFTPAVLYNPSASAPVGFYAIKKKYPIRKGALVAAYPPQWARILAAERGYLPADLPVLKSVWGEPGDKVCASKTYISVDGNPDIPVRETDRVGRVMPRWNECRTLQSGEYFLISIDVQTSFDSRYFGPVRDEDIIGNVRLIWRMSRE